MGALFGYCGQPMNGLLEKMAVTLGHRCPGGWERTRLPGDNGYGVEIGRGIPPWSPEPQATCLADDKWVFAYSGVIFNPDRITAGKCDTSAADLPAGLIRSPEQGLAALEGAFTGTLAQGRTL